MIVVGGEALMDLVPAPDQGRADGGLPLMLPRRGGGPYNTAVALGRLGAPVAFCSRVSTDAYGTALVEGLQKAGVDTALVQRGPEPTMLAVTAISEEGSAAYTFYHQGTADRLFTAPGSLPPRTRALALGTCSLAIEPTASAYEHMLLRESGRGLFIALDPNIRPNVIPDPDAYRARFRSWLPHLSLLKVSFEDTAWLSGCGADDDSVLDAARAWARTGPAAVVLTGGGAGLWAVTATGDPVHVPAAACEVADTIGAGDTVYAALLDGLHRKGALRAEARLTHDEWRELLTFAARAAAVTCSRRGADSPHRAELLD
ncbi:carbohydrate kinase [Streptomyces sp. NBC_00441]|uniref:carbohydrate kinase family protein n=1 Tax=Streptomyces sp. NBC_00441 TaxID=2975742 RepID=UPI002E28D430|nr:carbohydrate kinase [Streptomyces sp. NBC_00441]